MAKSIGPSLSLTIPETSLPSLILKVCPPNFISKGSTGTTLLSLIPFRLLLTIKLCSHMKIFSTFFPLLLEWLCRNGKQSGERQSGSKALEEFGSFRLWEIASCIKLNVFIYLAQLNPGG